MSDGGQSGGLFAQGSDGAEPLAARMRPRCFEEMVGQQHLVGPGSMLREAIDEDRLPSILLCGPAGTGKSTIARIIASVTAKVFVEMSAVNSGVADIRKAAQEAKERRQFHDQATILFVDEIHRLAKNQQDALLPHAEAGTFTLIGATTENPFYTVISPLRSRCQLYSLEPLAADEIEVVVRRALEDAERGIGEMDVELSEDALQHLVAGSGGDARAALNALDLAVRTQTARGERRVELAQIEEALQQPVLKYDRAGDEHYDTISAFIKSMRGSDPDASIYWLAKMLEAGEDPEFIARRMVILAAEDVGLADPSSLRVAIAAADAVRYVGMPEAQLPLAMAALHLAVAPKSNAVYRAIEAARADVRAEGGARVPRHLSGGLRVDDGADEEYRYPHSYAGGWVRQGYLPAEVAGRRYYEPKDNARERRIAEHLRQLWGPDRDEGEEGHESDRRPSEDGGK
jgi:putative ATPase